MGPTSKGRAEGEGGEEGEKREVRGRGGEQKGKGK